MIITEYLNDDNLDKHYSDSNYMRLQNETGVMYTEAIDVVPCRYTYMETTNVVESLASSLDLQ